MVHKLNVARTVKRVLQGLGLLALISFLIIVWLTVHVFNQPSLGAEKGLEVIFCQTKDDADCIILKQGSSAILIDSGDERDGAHILNLLRQNDIANITCMILTHPDKDHIGGAQTIIESLPVLTVLLPNYQKEHERLSEVKELLHTRNIALIVPTHTWKYVFGAVSLTVFPPLEHTYSKDNNYSLAVLAAHGDVKMFFAGDAEKKRTAELLEYNLPSVDLYKVAHHGRANSLSYQLIATLHPKWAVVTSWQADSAVSLALDAQQSQVLYTAGSDIVFYSDGSVLSLTDR